MKITIVSEKHKKAFNKASTHPVQSWEWGAFRKATGNKVIRFAVFKGKNLTDSVQLMIHKVPFTRFNIATLIKGPRPTKELIGKLREFAKKHNIIFIKLEPNYVLKDKDKDNILIRLLKESGAVPGKTLFTPTSFWIDLTKEEDDLLRSFSSKTRYNIRLASRKGVNVVEDNSKKAFDKYIKLTRQTVERQGFYAHSEKYHRLMWKYLHTDMVSAGKEPIARLLTARYQKEIITCWIVFVWHDFLYYPYGASTEKYKNVMANNLVMWEAILYAKRLGLKTFDLWGREPGKGFTRFKEGYNPEIVAFLGTWDLVINPFYYLYRAAEAFRWLFLRLHTKLGFARPQF